MEALSVANVLNYGLPIVTALLGLLYLARDWKSHKKSWRRLLVLGSIVLIGIGGAVNAYYARKEDMKQRAQYQEQVSGLQSAVVTANKNQEDNTRQFLAAFGQLSQEVSDLQTQVKTTGLREEADKLKAELESTQKALKPPKATLTFSFERPGPEWPVRRIVTVPVKDDVVHVEFTVLNQTDTPAVDGELTLRIPNECKFASEPPEFKKYPGQPETQRNYAFHRILPRTYLKTLSADVKVPPNMAKMEFGLDYRCTNCVLQDPIGNVGTVILDRTAKW